MTIEKLCAKGGVGWWGTAKAGQNVVTKPNGF